MAITQGKIEAGDLLVLPQGWKGEWIIHEHMRKLFVIDASSNLLIKSKGR